MSKYPHHEALSTFVKIEILDFIRKFPENLKSSWLFGDGKAYHGFLESISSFEMILLFGRLIVFLTSKRII